MDMVINMMIEYMGKLNVNDIFKCQMCGHKGRDKYIATPDIPALVDWKELFLCKKCAKRETGGKNNKKWNKLHE